KINVPLFFMVSGALLLEKQENIVTVLKKRISRVCLVILLFELGIFIECRLYALAQGRDYEFTVKRFIYGVFARELDETGAYWYLYAYLGFLCLLPLLQKLAKQMSRSDFYTLLTLHFVFLFIKYAVTIRIPILSAGRIAEAVCFMGSLTFGIYLLDHYFKLVLYSGYEAFAESFLPSLFASFGWCVISMFLGGMVTWILKKLPLFRKIL
ncbi:MAG: acyltransferase family protein, partial [Lachnospiraceae bacterium]|nr:acyltransferase family protein [Lachnospiraceae bacterium]